ncbi:MAG TPA: metallophosphoesterase [Pyrinomonadaceae bacterium]|nr:metallophosphoesterase [Pyrinomonadaceae bacterium]
MLRIAHISDLHIKHDDIKSEELSPLQRLAKVVAKAGGFSVEADGHSEDKVMALANAFNLLKPDVIVVTGDVTNFGDVRSFELASDYLSRLREAAGAEHVFCIPGNHDALSERAADIQSKPRGRLLLRLISWGDRTTEISASDPSRFSDDVLKRLDAGEVPALLDNYRAWAKKERFAEVDPGKPLYVNAAWGEVAFFLFNSTNDPGVMANEGRIGPKQFNALNVCLQDAEAMERCARAVRLALLHHHPISAPQSQDAAYNRGYDWMKDGPLFLQYMNQHGFHMVLHGHQHEPFKCTVNYADTPGSGMHIVAAGSATQGLHHTHNSFNLIDLLTPFEARLRRFDYSPTGFSANDDVDLNLPLRPIEEVRVTDAEEGETSEDWAMQHLVKGGEAGGAYELDRQHSYRELQFDVVVTKEQLYMASYRRAGVVVGEGPSEGPVFVISGSPAMKQEHMGVKARDNAANDGAGEAITWKSLVDKDCCKVFRARPHKELLPGDSFDITLDFQWQATESEPNHFDGVNLMYFHRPDRSHGHIAERLKYSVSIPWQPAQAKVRAYGVRDFAPELKHWEVKPVDAADPDAKKYGVTHRFSFEIERPQPVAYLIVFGPN